MSLILDIIAGDVALEREGTEFRGLCPFHSEARPTFYVIPDKGVFHCFGCGAHGDAIAFVMRRRGLDFIDAAKLIGAAWT